VSDLWLVIELVGWDGMGWEGIGYKGEWVCEQCFAGSTTDIGDSDMLPLLSV